MYDSLAENFHTNIKISYTDGGAVLNRLFCFDSQNIVTVLLIALSVLSLPIVSLSHYAYAHSTVDSGAIVKTIDNKYQIAFQIYPKFVSAGQNATLHFSILEDRKSTLLNSSH